MRTLHSSFLSSVATRSKLSTCSVTACLPHWNIMKNLKLEVSWSTTFVVVSCLTLQISIWIPEASSSGTYNKGNWEGCLPERKSAGIKRYKKRDVRGRQFTMQYSREVPSYPTWEWPNPKSPSKWKPFKPKSTTDMPERTPWRCLFEKDGCCIRIGDRNVPSFLLYASNISIKK